MVMPLALYLLINNVLCISTASQVRPKYHYILTRPAGLLTHKFDKRTCLGILFTITTLEQLENSVCNLTVNYRLNIIIQYIGGKLYSLKAWLHTSTHQYNYCNNGHT